MALISGVLCGPYNDPRVGVAIQMRALKTSATVLNLAVSQSVTDDDGHYSLTVEPGAYEVIISGYGAKPERVGTIVVYADSQPGTLNDFLRRPDESDITPEIIQTVDRMRADAAESAAAAKLSEQNSANTLKNAAQKNKANTFSLPQKIDTLNTQSPSLIISSNASESLRVIRNNADVKNSNIAIKFEMTEKDTGATLMGKYLGINNTGTAYVSDDVNLSAGNPLVVDSAIGQRKTIAGALAGPTNFTFTNQKDVDAPSFMGAGATFSLLTFNWYVTTENPLPYSLQLIARNSKLGFRTVDAGVGSEKGFCELWHTGNTTTDSNGFIKKASPIVKLFCDGTCELNDESAGVTTERVSEGVYRVSGVLGFNSDDTWGGPDGGIEVPLDRNKQPLIWVDYEVEATGDLLIKTYHRTHPTAPVFARNEIVGYDEGMPIDIPADRWIDLRVEMPEVESVTEVADSEQ
ncbi:prophage tail fiber N-terminal domain-containing protein [Serratia sp. NPDC078593]|uniref:phage tail fiber protein n=1 Tax=unclassified Serratia (in: enterobacteria) TaxID=2647522 RepID=UPI0037CE5630